MTIKKIEYSHGNHTLEAFVAYPKASSPKPAVLIAHAWRGRDEFVEQKARQMAALGYVGIAVDVYGKGILGTDVDSCLKLMQPLMDDRALLRERLQSGYDVVKTLQAVDTNHIAAIGYCFGGLCVLDMARHGMELCGVVSVHGILSNTDHIANKAIKPKVLVLHGFDDPMVLPEATLNFQKEMTAAQADWQFHTFGNTTHAFTNPKANEPLEGRLYSSVADRRTNMMIEQFLVESFS